jgi:AcrR family transcriptional regulator
MVRPPTARAAVPSEKARTTRAALVQSAGALFVDEGYGAVSVRDVARDTGLTSGAIYGHFRNKADLLVAALSDRISSDLESPSHGRGGLSDYMARQWRAYRARRGMRALAVEAAHAAHVDDDARRRLGEMQEAKLREWGAIYRSVQQEQGIDPDVDMEALLILLWSAELGLGILEAWDVELPKPATWARLIKRVLESLESQTAEP